MNGKTVYIIGAGASWEANLPLGDKLKGLIVEYLTFRELDIRGEPVGDRLIVSALLNNTNKRLVLDACNKICESLPMASSIDHYLNTHNKNEGIIYCGKLAIVRSINEAEKVSHFFPKNSANIDFMKINDTWYSLFFRTIVDHIDDLEKLKERLRSMVLVIFNYDRCIEQYLYYAIQRYFHIPTYETQELIKNITFYYPYGKVGQLPWLCTNYSDGLCDFGENLTPDKLIQLSCGIRTFSESMEDKTNEIEEIRSQIINAGKLIFLGFAYHDQNMKLLFPSTNNLPINNKEITIYGTTYGMSMDNIRNIKTYFSEIVDNTDDQLNLFSGTCQEFYKDYRISLSFQ